jgi:hypothetical protein
MGTTEPFGTGLAIFSKYNNVISGFATRSNDRYKQIEHNMRSIPQRILSVRVEFWVAMASLLMMLPQAFASWWVSYPVDSYCNSTPGCKKIKIAELTQSNDAGTRFREEWVAIVSTKELNKAGLSEDDVRDGLQQLAAARYNRFEKMMFLLDDPYIVISDQSKGRHTK